MMTPLAGRLWVPDATRALLWDMDGVLLDTLGLDLTVCNRLLEERFGEGVRVEPDFIRSLFAYDPVEFWRRILRKVERDLGVAGAVDRLDDVLPAYDEARMASRFELNPGVREVLAAARERGIRSAVVSNNPTADVRAMLDGSGILDDFDRVIGNDLEGTRKKPAPDTYLLGARELGVAPGDCVVIEDSIVGAEAGRAAGCYVAGVATGGADFDVLEDSDFTDRVYTTLVESRLELERGHVTDKRIVTGNELVSHMIEHVAWRLGTRIDLTWSDDDWHRLGERLGASIGVLERERDRAVALGMIDDGSAEVAVEIGAGPEGRVRSIANVDLEWFLDCRCEQLRSGRPLVRLIEGLARGLGARISVEIWSVEDPHHTWEGVFRSIGIALERLLPRPDHAPGEDAAAEPVSEAAIEVEERSVHRAKVVRKTAESRVAVAVDFTGTAASGFELEVPPSLRVRRLGDLLAAFAEAAGMSLHVRFEARVLGSSHVVVEDVGLVLGRALKEVLVLRMEHWGVYGAGGSLESREDLERPIRVALSVEGRKCWKLVPARDSYDALRKRFLIGHEVLGELYSEDLDDFLDGLSGGLGCSIMVHFDRIVDAAEGWPLLFAALGTAVRQAFEPNPYRRGVPPGVKATLS